MPRPMMTMRSELDERHLNSVNLLYDWSIATHRRLSSMLPIFRTSFAEPVYGIVI
jgi:hypothetical protein